MLDSQQVFDFSLSSGVTTGVLSTFQMPGLASYIVSTAALLVMMYTWLVKL